MKILLDTSFLRHLEQIGQLDLISNFIESSNWKFILPGIVYNELDAFKIPKKVKRLLKNNKIDIITCSDLEFKIIKARLLGLDDGELDAICIIDRCKDRTFKNYLFLTDDISAQHKAGKLGINSLDVLMFLLFSNQKGFVSKELVSNAMVTLEKEGYFIDFEVKKVYRNQLV